MVYINPRLAQMYLNSYRRPHLLLVVSVIKPSQCQQRFYSALARDARRVGVGGSDTQGWSRGERPADVKDSSNMEEVVQIDFVILGGVILPLLTRVCR